MRSYREFVARDRSFYIQAKVARSVLIDIDKLLDELERVDPYGDMVENFCDFDKVRHTKRLIELIDEDLSRR